MLSLTVCTDEFYTWLLLATTVFTYMFTTGVCHGNGFTCKKSISSQITQILHNLSRIWLCSMAYGKSASLPWWRETYTTRKSSCVNARGIPTVAYQVLHLLSYPGRGGGFPGWWVPPTSQVRMGGTHPWLGPVTGVPPGKDMGPVEALWDGDGIPLLNYKGNETNGSIMVLRWRWCTIPPPPPPWTGRHLWKQNLPSYDVRGRQQSQSVFIWLIRPYINLSGLFIRLVSKMCRFSISHHLK